MCGDAWFLWSPSSSEPRGALLSFFNDYFSSVENLSQSEHDSAFTWQVHCAIYTKTFLPSSLDVHTSWFVFSFLRWGIFYFLLFGGKDILSDCIIRPWNFLNPSPFSKTWILTRPTVPHLKLWGGKKLERKQQPLCCTCRYWGVTPSTWTCTLPLCMPQPHPSWDWMVLVSGTIPNKRGFS